MSSREDLSKELVPGTVPEDQLALLLAGTSIRGSGLIAALRDHLVHGQRAVDAYKAHGVDKTLFSRRLGQLRGESARARELSRFYRPDPAGETGKPQRQQDNASDPGREYAVTWPP